MKPFIEVVPRWKLIVSGFLLGVMCTCLTLYFLCGGLE